MNPDSKVNGQRSSSRNRRKLWLFGGSDETEKDKRKKEKDKRKKDKKKKDDDDGGKSATRTKSITKVVAAPSISLSACVLAVYGSPVAYHDDSLTAAADSSSRDAVNVLSEDDAEDLDRRMMKVLRQAFPSWYVDSGMSRTAASEVATTTSSSSNRSWLNPLTNTSAYPRSSRLNSFCLKY